MAKAKKKDDPVIPPWVIGTGIAFGAFAIARVLREGRGGRSGGGGPSGAYNAPPPKSKGVSFARGASAPLWPLKSTHRYADRLSYLDVNNKLHGNGARMFGAKRGSKTRRHAGVDLYAEPGDLVIATEDGTISAMYHFYHGAYALLVCTDTGITINYGEVKKDSWKEFGLKKGDRVRKGEPIARIGVMSGGSHMLHFETYRGCVKRNERWFQDRSPKTLLDPTDYLLRGRQRMERGTRTALAPPANDPFPREDRKPQADEMLKRLLVQGAEPGQATEETYLTIYPECPAPLNTNDEAHFRCLDEYQRLMHLARVQAPGSQG